MARPTILHLGVSNIPYSYGGATRTSGDVAKILEAKYGIMQTFWDGEEKEKIIPVMTQTVQYAINAMVAGRPVGREPLQTGLDRLGRDFRKYIMMKKLDGKARGVPTAASLRGVNHRMRHPYARRGARPSFVDSGLYVGAFRAWLD